MEKRNPIYKVYFEWKINLKITLLHVELNKKQVRLFHIVRILTSSQYIQIKNGDRKSSKMGEKKIIVTYQSLAHHTTSHHIHLHPTYTQILHTHSHKEREEEECLK